MRTSHSGTQKTGRWRSQTDKVDYSRPLAGYCRALSALSASTPVWSQASNAVGSSSSPYYAEPFSARRRLRVLRRVSHHCVWHAAAYASPATAAGAQMTTVAGGASEQNSFSWRGGVSAMRRFTA